MKPQDHPRPGGLGAPQAVLGKSAAGAAAPMPSAQQSVGSPPRHLRGALGLGTPVSQFSVHPSTDAASTGSTAESLHPRGKLVMVPPHLMGRKVILPHPAAFADPHAPLAQHAKKHVVSFVNVKQDAPGQPRPGRSGPLEHAPGIHDGVSPRLVAASPAGPVQLAHASSVKAQRPAYVAGYGAIPPPSSIDDGMKHKSSGGLWKGITSLFKLNTGKEEQRIERAPPRTSYAKAGAAPIERRPGAGAAEGGRTAAAAPTQNSGQNTGSRAAGDRAFPQETPPQQQQHNCQQLQSKPHSSSLTSVGDDGQATAPQSGDRPGLSALPALPVGTRSRTPLLEATTHRVTPVDPAITPLVVPPTVYLRNEAGEAGIAPSSSVQATTDGERGQRQSQQARRVALFPSFAIVDSDEDSLALADSGQSQIEPKATTQADVVGQVEAEASQEQGHGFLSSVSVLSPPSRLLTEQDKNESTGAQTASTRLHASSGSLTTPEVKQFQMVKKKSLDALAMEARTPVRQPSIQGREAVDIHPSIVTPQGKGETDANPPKETLQQSAMAVSSGTQSLQSTKIGGDVQNDKTLHTERYHQPCSSSSLGHHAAARRREAQRKEDGADDGSDGLHKRGCKMPPPAEEPSSPVVSRKLSRNTDKAGDTNSDDSNEDAANRAHDNRRWHRSDRRGTEKDACREGRKLLSPPSFLSVHSPIFHTRDVYKLYQELQRQQHKLQRDRFSRWRAHNVVSPDRYSRESRHIGGHSLPQPKDSRQPWRSSSFHLGSLPPPSPLLRPLGYIGFGGGYSRSVDGKALHCKNGYKASHAPSGQCSPYQSLQPSRLVLAQRAETPSTQRRRWLHPNEPREYSPSHPYELVSFFPPCMFNESRRSSASANARVCGHRTTKDGPVSYGGDSTPARVYPDLDGHGEKAAKACGGAQAQASPDKNDGKTPESPLPRHPKQQPQRGCRRHPVSVTPPRPVSTRRQRDRPRGMLNGGTASPPSRRPQTRSVVKDLTVRRLHRCCSEGGIAGGDQFRTTGWSANMANTGQWLDEVVEASLGKGRGDSAAALTSAGRLPVPVVDLRRDFKPCLDPPLNTKEAFGGPYHRVHCGVNYSASIKRSSAHKKGNGVCPQGAVSPHCGNHTVSTSLRRSPGDAAVTASCSPQRHFVDVPPFPPLKMYSSFQVKEPDRPSAWAVGPERSNLLADSPTARRRMVKRTHSGDKYVTPATSDGGHPAAEDATAETRGECVVLVEEVRLDEQRRPYVVIREVPCGAAAVEAQKTSVNRLSTPRSVYLRRDNGAPS
ncbi:hypothetical protein TraAM80_04507 [Trypanosoma rangeli]|uniref:Uncharacterized protein n=1 Tax=Trypanosoma rangeli TaxID=5698 RepID=A0A422NJA1_TRYRA|nr:uncharacterized protein TraAM80_04507 [Trypanosoma rangeli]RNF05568.1 hypothetical protein TraAM80_04507 [Trypanosoma rangeli]|eukprot:RNF05568.1 hypothetical protein TraAM80_04507 [Trypanosoma rangeli]